MKTKILEKFEDLFSNMEDFSMEKLEGLVHESLKFFDDLKNVLESDNEEDQKKAMEIAQKLQSKLEQQADQAYSAAGLSKSEVETFLKDSSNFSKDDWNSFNKIQGEITEYQSDFLEQPVSEKKEAPKKTKASKTRRKPLTHIPG